MFFLLLKSNAGEYLALPITDNSLYQLGLFKRRFSALESNFEYDRDMSKLIVNTSPATRDCIV